MAIVHYSSCAVIARLTRTSRAALGATFEWWPELVLGALAAGMVLADGLRSSAGDPAVFYGYAAQVTHGQLPLRDFPFEYPPLDVIPMLLPYLLMGSAPSLDVYRFLLLVENVVLLVAIGAGVAWLARRGVARETPRRSVVLYALAAAALAPVIVWRVDTAVTALTAAALIAAMAARPAVSGLALGAGVMTKLYPIALLPALALGQVRERRWRPAIVLAGVALLSIATVGLGILFAGGVSPMYFVQYAVERGVQIESIPGALALLAAAAGGPGAHIVPGFGTMEVESALLPGLEALGAAVTVGGIAALGLGLWCRFSADRQSFGGMQPASQATYLLAAGLLVLVTSRILSPQYIFWVVPFAALVSRGQALLLLIACLLTTLVCPLNYQQYIYVAPLVVLVANARNAILLALFVWLIASDLGSFVRGALSGRGRVKPPLG